MWIIMAWQCISPEMTAMGFKKWCISTAMGETDEVMLWNDSKEDGNVQSECKEDESTDHEEGNNDSDW
jgi:hypothetical protein